MFAEGISKSLDTVLATTLGTTYHNRLKKSNPNLLKSEKSLSNNSSKSSSGSSLTLTNNQNLQGSSINNNQINQYPHHQFYCSQISTSDNWNSNRSNSIHSQNQKVKIIIWRKKLFSVTFYVTESELILFICVFYFYCCTIKSTLIDIVYTVFY